MTSLAPESAEPARLTGSQRRRAIRLSYANAALWAVGNGLTTGALITYLAMDLGATGLNLSFLLALPALVGLLRLFAPQWIRYRGTSRRVMLESSLASYIVLALLPVLALDPQWAGRWSLVFVIAVYCGHQLLEYIGSVALYAWINDLVPARVRGRYFGRRQIYQLALLIPALIASGWFTDWWKQAWPDEPLWGYSLVTACGVLLLVVSLLPLVFMPATYGGAGGAANWRQAVRDIVQPVADARYRRLLYFGCWLSFFNGVTQVAQGRYPWEVLGLGLTALAVMRSGMRLGQIGVSALAGPLCDRYGNRPVLIVAQLAVAAGPLFYLLASPEGWGLYWIGVAYLAWAGYAAMNVGLPNLMLKLAPSSSSASYVASYWALTGMVYAVATVLGGLWFDLLARWPGAELLGVTFTHYDVQFLFGWITRSLAVVWLMLLVEPGALGVGEMLRDLASRLWHKAARRSLPLERAVATAPGDS